MIHIINGVSVDIRCTGPGDLLWQARDGPDIPEGSTFLPSTRALQSYDSANRRQSVLFLTFDSRDNDVYTCSSDLDNIRAESALLTTGKIKSTLHNWIRVESIIPHYYMKLPFLASCLDNNYDHGHMDAFTCMATSLDPMT